jgi:hypothetical protein
MVIEPVGSSISRSALIDGCARDGHRLALPAGSDSPRSPTVMSTAGVAVTEPDKAAHLGGTQHRRIVGSGAGNGQLSRRLPW